MSGKRALITGATGFVGSHLVPRLRDEGWQVAIVTRPTSQAPSGVSAIVDTGDVAELTQAIAAFQPTTCFHLATNFVGVHTPSDVNALIESNVAFGARLLEALSTLENIAFINVGTVWQHYEGRPYGPTSLYAATKQSFQDIVQFYAECTAVTAATLELTDTYGPGDTRKKLLNLLVETAESQTELSMSAGEQLFDVLHIEDVIDALLNVSQRATHEAPTFGIGSENPLPLREFVAIVSDVIGKPIPINWGARPYRPREMMRPWRAVTELPDWQQKIKLEDGLSELLNGSTVGKEGNK